MSAEDLRYWGSQANASAPMDSSGSEDIGPSPTRKKRKPKKTKTKKKKTKDKKAAKKKKGTKPKKKTAKKKKSDTKAAGGKADAGPRKKRPRKSVNYNEQSPAKQAAEPAADIEMTDAKPAEEPAPPSPPSKRRTTRHSRRHLHPKEHGSTIARVEEAPEQPAVAPPPEPKPSGPPAPKPSPKAVPRAPKSSPAAIASKKPKKDKEAASSKPKKKKTNLLAKPSAAASAAPPKPKKKKSSAPSLLAKSTGSTSLPKKKSVVKRKPAGGGLLAKKRSGAPGGGGSSKDAKSKKASKKAKPAMLKGEAAKQLTKEYMLKVNRPYTHTIIFENLMKRVSKSKLPGILDELTKEGVLTKKSWKKTSIYWANQANFPDVSPEELEKRRAHLKQLQGEEAARESKRRTLKSKLTRITETPNDKNLVNEIAAMKKQLAEKKAKLKGMTGDRPALNTKELKRMCTKGIKAWKHRKKMLEGCMFYADHISEQMDIKPKRWLYAKVEIDNDKDYNVDVVATKEYVDKLRALKNSIQRQEDRAKAK